ncbi:tetraspanin [Echinococcus multilocularis]|uniref:Tetraspanin n=1 Tax=Echinococcus multilocularis TaxID=6211 RepID=A0A068Y059_ECHMU|nr:tetraspanin [Echinococcus multilocularis]
MCCAAAGIFTCIIVIINTILGTGFLVMVIFGILLRFLLPFVKSAIATVFTHLGLSDGVKTMCVEFLQLRSNELSNVCLIFGTACFCLCIVACMLACCGSLMMLRIYGGILGITVFLEGIGIIVLFSTQNLFINVITSVLSILLRDFENFSGFSTVIWSLIMQKENGVRCCGMDSPNDFNVSYLPSGKKFTHTCRLPPPSGICPRECCAIALNEVCQCNSPKLHWVFGCRSRIINFLRREMKNFTLISVGILLVQFILFTLTAAALLAKLRLCQLR